MKKQHFGKRHFLGRVSAFALTAVLFLPFLWTLPAKAAPTENPKKGNPETTLTEIPVTVLGVDSTVTITPDAANPQGAPVANPASLSMKAGDTNTIGFTGTDTAPPGDYYYTVKQSPNSAQGFETTEYTVLLRVFNEEQRAGDGTSSKAFVTVFTGAYNSDDSITGVKYDACEFENIVKRDAETWGYPGQTQTGFNDTENKKTATSGNNNADKNPSHPFTTDGTTDTNDGTKPLVATFDKNYTISLNNGKSGSGDTCKEGAGSLTIPAYDSKTNAQCGTYTLHVTTNASGQKIVTVTFTPNAGYTGDPIPATLTATSPQNANGTGRTHNDITAIYQPHVVPKEVDKKPPTGTDAETWGEKGKQQSSEDSVKDLRFKKGSGSFTSIKLVDPYSLDPYDESKRNSGTTVDGNVIDALDRSGNVIGTYTLVIKDLKNGVITVLFQPNADFVGDPQPCLIRAVDENGFEVTILYQPHVTDKESPSPTPTPTPSPSGGGSSTTTPPATPTATNPPSLVEQIVQSVTGNGSYTGDNSRMLLWGGLFGGALLVLLVFLARRRKNTQAQ